MPVFESQTTLSRHPDEVFDFICRPENLCAIAPPELQMVFVNPPPLISLGTRLVCKVQVFGQMQQMEYEITQFESPRRFREESVGGPLSKWVHDYEVHSADGGSVLINRIEFAPPGGLLGFILTADRIEEHLEEGFAHRREALRKLLG